MQGTCIIWNLVAFFSTLSFLLCISAYSVVPLTVKEKEINAEEWDTIPLRFNFPSWWLLLFFFLICFGFVFRNSLLLHKISCTRAHCMESFCSKLCLTPDRCYTDTARCAYLSQLHKPLTAQQCKRQCRAVSSGRTSERLSWDQHFLNKFNGDIWSKAQAEPLFAFLGGEQLGLISYGACLTSRDLMHAQLGVDGSCVWVGCAL